MHVGYKLNFKFRDKPPITILSRLSSHNSKSSDEYNNQINSLFANVNGKDVYLRAEKLTSLSLIYEKIFFSHIVFNRHN